MWASAPTEAYLVVRRGGALPLPRATARVAPTERFVGADDPVRPMWVCNIFVGQGPCALPWVRGKNPPVTASPCQPPLGKGAEGTGDADCHSQCAHWLRNDSFFTGCAVRRRGEGTPPYERLQEVRWVSLRCVGEGLSCPPSCQPTDGHCRARQSGHFLETGLLHPPLAALRRFPLPRAG